MKVLALQNNAVLNNKEANFNNVERLLQPYLNDDIDLIVLPEVWACGWDCGKFEESAEEITPELASPTIDFLRHIAQKHKSMIAGGSFITKNTKGELKNTMPVITDKGKVLALYDKMHLFSHKGSEEQKYISPGDKLLILDLDYTKVGLTICYDIRFPEVFREYSKRGVEIFINSAAWGKNKLMHWETMHRARAIENQCFMIAADQTGKISGDNYNLGHSMIISPWGDIIERMGEEEGCIVAELDLGELRKLRQNFPLLADRRNEQFEIKEINPYD